MPLPRLLDGLLNLRGSSLVGSSAARERADLLSEALLGRVGALDLRGEGIQVASCRLGVAPGCGLAACLGDLRLFCLIDGYDTVRLLRAYGKCGV